MNDEYFRKVVRAWLPLINDIKDNKAELERQLFYMAKDVSRDTRHKAFDLAQQHANAIINMNTVE